MQRGNAVRELRRELTYQRTSLQHVDEDHADAGLLEQGHTRPHSAASFVGEVDTVDGKVPTWWSPKSDARAIWGLVTSSWMNIFLLMCPAGVLCAELMDDHNQWKATLVFTLNFFGIIPLALILGDVTEDLAVRCGDVIGGLVNATFGNVVELILSIVALHNAKVNNNPALNDVAGLSNLGSVLSNLLLVLGCCFFFGGLYHKKQTFNAMANQVTNSLLFLAVVALTLPCAASYFPDTHFNEADMLLYSRILSIILLCVYLVYLYFQLISHQDMFLAAKDEAADEEEEAVEGEAETAALTVTAELSTLLVISTVVAVASEYITDSIQDMSKSSGLTTEFLSVVLLPIAGNAVEHITAVMVAMKNKMDLALGIAIGSSIQIAIFVLPTCVLASWAMDNNFSLLLSGLGTVSLAVAIVHANFISGGGQSHYLMGVQLIATYFIISCAFLFTSEDKKQ